MLPAKNTNKNRRFICDFFFLLYFKNANLVGMGRNVIWSVPDVSSGTVTVSAESADDTNVVLTSMDPSATQHASRNV